MRVIGLLGGMSWESSAEYYRLLNQGVRARLGGMHSARLLMWSFDFSDVEVLQAADRWDEAADLLIDAAQRLERGGAEALLLCTNTMHLLAPALEGAVGIPLLHIADPTAACAVADGVGCVGLLGTAFTMERDFYADRLRVAGLHVIVPDADDRARVHRTIYDELVQGRIEDASRDAMRGVIARLIARGAGGIVLGCTELMLLIRPQDSAVPLFDTTALHVRAAIDWSLEGDP